MARYILSPDADRDVVEITAHIAEDSIDAALSVQDRLLESMRLLAENQGQGHSRADLTARELRFFSVFTYLIVYRPCTSPLQIIRVLSSRRDVGAMLR